MVTRNAMIILLKKQAFKRGSGFDPEEPLRNGKFLSSSPPETDNIRATTTVEGRYTQIRLE